MTCLQELKDLQKKARIAGRTCTFFRETDDSEITSVFYMDPKGKGRTRGGLLMDTLGFAEKERVAPYWDEMPESRIKNETTATGIVRYRQTWDREGKALAARDGEGLEPRAR